MRLLLWIPGVRRSLWKEWQRGYEVGFNVAGLAADIAAAYPETTDTAVAKLVPGARLNQWAGM